MKWWKEKLRNFIRNEVSVYLGELAGETENAYLDAMRAGKWTSQMTQQYGVQQLQKVRRPYPREIFEKLANGALELKIDPAAPEGDRKANPVLIRTKTAEGVQMARLLYEKKNDLGSVSLGFKWIEGGLGEFILKAHKHDPSSPGVSRNYKLDRETTKAVEEILAGRERE